ncbi:MAG: hypothetical protein AAF773_11435 [Cyanobacteria bacterium P01_D01_bin.115]
MTILRLGQALSAASLLSFLVVALPAAADTAEPGDASNQLLPLETRGMSVEVDPNLYQSAAEEINTFESPNSSNSSGLSDIGIFDDIVDENGELDLPLGITVFDSMGSTSVGVGSDF